MLTHSAAEIRVNRKYNFEELNLGLVASQSQCLRDYCERLILGIETEQFKKMPFYCLNENDTWYMYLKELAKQEKIRRSRLHPYTLFWEFRIDNVENKIDTKYIVKGIFFCSSKKKWSSHRYI